MMMDKEKLWLRTWIEVSTAALARNYRTFRDLIGPACRLMAVAKSNAYGHGLVDYSRTLQALGADWIGVDSIVEANTLRREGITTPLLVLGYTLPTWYPEAAAQGISLTISNFDGIRHLLDADLPTLRVHLKIDTGMHRQGFQLHEVDQACALLRARLPVEAVEGLYTHFAAAKNPADPEATRAQIARFDAAAAIAAGHGFTPLRHAAATGGAIVFPEARYDLVRIGIGLMGLWPSQETRAAFERSFTLEPALAWRTIISEIKQIATGDAVGYDFTEQVTRDTALAILPIGYWHGYRRALSGIGQVLVRGQRAKVLGRVSMDMVCIDVTDIPDIQPGDVVTLLGRDGDDAITAYELARLTQASWYEMMTQINPLIKKYYV